MKVNWNRIFSLLIAIIYIFLAFAGPGAESAWKAGVFVIFPLAAIWFPDALGGYIGPASGGRIGIPTSGVIVCIGGWLLLLLPVAIEFVSAIAGAK